MLEHDYATLGQSYVRTTPPHTPHAAVILYNMWVCMSVCLYHCLFVAFLLVYVSFFGLLSCPFVILWPVCQSFCPFRILSPVVLSMNFRTYLSRCLSVMFCFSFCHSDCDRRQIDNIKAGQSDLSQRWPPKHWMRPTTLLSVTAISENILRVLFQDLVKFIVNLKGW